MGYIMLYSSVDVSQNLSEAHCPRIRVGSRTDSKPGLGALVYHSDSDRLRFIISVLLGSVLSHKCSKPNALSPPHQGSSMSCVNAKSGQVEHKVRNLENI